MVLNVTAGNVSGGFIKEARLSERKDNPHE